MRNKKLPEAGLGSIIKTGAKILKGAYAGGKAASAASKAERVAKAAEAAKKAKKATAAKKAAATRAANKAKKTETASTASKATTTPKTRGKAKAKVEEAKVETQKQKKSTSPKKMKNIGKALIAGTVAGSLGYSMYEKYAKSKKARSILDDLKKKRNY